MLTCFVPNWTNRMNACTGWKNAFQLNVCECSRTITRTHMSVSCAIRSYVCVRRVCIGTDVVDFSVDTKWRAFNRLRDKTSMWFVYGLILLLLLHVCVTLALSLPLCMSNLIHFRLVFCLCLAHSINCMKSICVCVCVWVFATRSKGSLNGFPYEIQMVNAENRIQWVNEK